MVEQGDAFTHVPEVLSSPMAGDQTMLLPVGTPVRQRVAESQAAMVAGSTVMVTFVSGSAGDSTVMVVVNAAVLVTGGQVLPQAVVVETVAV